MRIPQFTGEISLASSRPVENSMLRRLSENLIPPQCEYPRKPVMQWGFMQTCLKWKERPYSKTEWQPVTEGSRFGYEVVVESGTVGVCVQHGPVQLVPRWTCE